MKQLITPVLEPCEGEVIWTDEYWNLMKDDGFFLDGRNMLDGVRPFRSLKLRTSIDPRQPIDINGIQQDLEWMKRFFEGKDHIYVKKVWAKVTPNLWDENFCWNARCFALVKTVP